MFSRLHWISTALILCACFAATSEVAALEKTHGVITEDRAPWRGNTTVCTVSYFNVCTGWIWVYEEWDPEDRLGVCFDACCTENASLLSTAIFFDVGSPSGYGFTGSIDVWNADGSNCPTGAPIHSQQYLPTTSWNIINLSPAPLVPSKFVVTYTTGPGDTNPMKITSDHPEAGPSGPPAAGTCYPSPRAVQSRYYGTVSAPRCDIFVDAAGGIEWIWDAQVQCSTPVESSSWADIKALYR